MLTSTVVILIPAGFHRRRFHPSTHIAPRLSKLTVPSPSPILTPFLTLGQAVSFVYAASIQLLRDSGIFNGLRLVQPSMLSSWHSSSAMPTVVSSCSNVPVVYLNST